VGVVSRKVAECMGAAVEDALVDVEDCVGVGVGDGVVELGEGLGVGVAEEEDGEELAGTI
jgi:hypothetical protein